MFAKDISTIQLINTCKIWSHTAKRGATLTLKWTRSVYKQSGFLGWSVVLLFDEISSKLGQLWFCSSFFKTVSSWMGGDKILKLTRNKVQVIFFLELKSTAPAFSSSYQLINKIFLSNKPQPSSYVSIKIEKNFLKQ